MSCYGQLVGFIMLLSSSCGFLYEGVQNLSHAKDVRVTSATVCIFIARKVEDAPRPLKVVILDTTHAATHACDRADIKLWTAPKPDMVQVHACGISNLEVCK